MIFGGSEKCHSSLTANNLPKLLSEPTLYLQDCFLGWGSLYVNHASLRPGYDFPVLVWVVQELRICDSLDAQPAPVPNSLEWLWRSCR